MGKTLQDLPNISWEYVKKEKSPDMIHVLQFPYNGEPPRVRVATAVLDLVEDHLLTLMQDRLVKVCV
jgi:sulfite oxidase